jgi:ubiquinone/menaquinone biosynthesis C-methylase UbiE
VDFYSRFRRGYPAAVIDSLVDAFTLTAEDVVADLGCGTGQLTIPLAGRVRTAIGVDPEADMLAAARRTAERQGVANVTWLVGTDTDLPVLGEGLAAVTIAQALHWMRPDTLFTRLAPLLRDGGGVAVVTNGLPLWQQDSDWSRALRRFLEDWLGTELSFACGTDEESQRRYQQDLTTAGFEVHPRTVEYTDEVDLDYLIGNVYSALSVDQLPDDRERFRERLTRVLKPPFVEKVQVRMLIGRMQE